ncbi:MAG: hypothetical protein J7L45_03120 [Candidatus Aenigmarchaeota archaeon]|nr:hypothetical protein [Candidatus Aenigmarchaeota archaeon]
MMYPEEVLTRTKKGKIEARVLKDRGEFITYEYIDPKTNKKENKIKLILKGKEVKEFFIIPLKDGRSLLLPAEPKGKRKIWDPIKNKTIEV